MLQNHDLDDRPLYWARLKMQAWLKRHPAFILGRDYESNSQVKKGSKLDTVITLFEEKSRNYTGIDFGRAGGKKKLLMTGFDPFVLNSAKYTWAHIDTQNPSGIMALYFHGKTIGNAYIQCAIIPVRYEDFDNGIIESIVGNNIKSFDTMITMSRNDENFDLERFACKFRGGFFDNMNIGDATNFIKKYRGLNINDWDKSRFKQIPDGNEFYETTLPIAKILTGDLDTSKDIVYFDQSIIDDTGFVMTHPDKTSGMPPNTVDKLFDFSSIKGKSTFESGSGGDYLSNEVMYRATRKRDETGHHNDKQVGHVHISYGMEFSKVIDILTKIITNATK